MQSKTELTSPAVDSKESLYRTKWLMAHNRLHAIVHGSPKSLAEQWNEYLAELQSSEAVAKTLA